MGDGFTPTGAEPGQRLLLVCPPLFSYHLSIKAELESRGFAVTWWNDRAREGALHKLGLRLWPAWFARRSTPWFRRRLHALDNQRFDHVLVVKGEGLSPAFMGELKRQLPEARLALYLWDSVENTRGATGLAPLFHAVATFDPVDADIHGWRHRPLFASAEPRLSPGLQTSLRFDWCFIGTVHSDRHRVIERLRRSDPKRRSFIFGYVPSRLLMAARYVCDVSLWKAPRNRISTRAMSPEDVAAIARSSRAILDIEHPRQRGLTMRTVETLLSGHKLITTNRYVLASDLYHPSRVHVISRDEPSVPDAFLDSPFEPIEATIRDRYTLGRWASDLLSAPLHGHEGHNAKFVSSRADSAA